MEGISLVIADKDSDFLYQISKYILDREINFELAVFTDLESLSSYSKNRYINILVLDEKFAEINYISSLESDIKILMTFNNKKIQGFNSVDKNQKIEVFMNQITDIYFKQEMDALMKEINIVITESTSMIGFFGVSGGTGCTTLSLALAASKSLKGEAAFYINFEKYNSSTNFLTSDKNISTDEVEKVLNDKETFEIEKIYKLCSKETKTGIYFFPFNITNDEYFKYFYKLIDLIIGSKTFSYIIFDFSSDFSDRMEIMNMLEKKILVVNDNFFSLKKTELFLKKNIGLKDMNIVLNKNSNVNSYYNYNFDFNLKIAEIHSLKNEFNLVTIKNYFEKYTNDII